MIRFVHGPAKKITDPVETHTQKDTHQKINYKPEKHENGEKKSRAGMMGFLVT